MSRDPTIGMFVGDEEIERRQRKRLATATQTARETAENGCQQVLQVERPYWRERPECGKVARFTWNSDLRGKLRLCRRHAKAVGIEHCAPVRSKE